MTLSPEESKDGLYDVYYGMTGEKILVLEGLDPADVYEAPYLQRVINEYYGAAELFYWLLFIVTIVYMAGLYVVFPVLRKHHIF